MDAPLENYCCKMRRHFVLGIRARTFTPVPTEVVDFVSEWGQAGSKNIIRIKFCPFCGRELGPDQTVRTIKDP